MTKILSINGGGIKGVGVAKLLQLIARDSLEPKDTFDCLMGTSTGAIISALLATGSCGVDVVSKYKKFSKVVFSKKNLIPLYNKYNNQPLMSALREEFGDTKFYDVDKPLYIGYYDAVRNGSYMFSKKNNGDMPLWESVLTSCSAPTFFPPIARRFADGGIILNNPTVLGTIKYCRDYKIDLQSLKVMSLDTDGANSGNLLPKRVTVLEWAKRIIGSATGGSDNTMAYIAENLPYSDYIRLSPKTDSVFAMDDITIIQDYIDLWHSYYNENKDNIITFIEER